MIRETFPVGLLSCNCTILGDEITRTAIVVDPGDDIPKILAVLQKHGLTLRQILVTHAHIDHIAGAALLKEMTGAPVQYHQADLPQVDIMDVQAGWLGVPTPTVNKPDAELTHLMGIQLGAIAGIILHTPGHTPGSVCLYVPEEHLLLAGDTLFAGSVGRTDLPGGDGKQLIRSIREHVLSLPERTLVVPGHGKTTQIGIEREQNPFLSRQSQI